MFAVEVNTDLLVFVPEQHLLMFLWTNHLGF